MNILKLGLATICLCMLNVANAGIMAANLSQDNKAVEVELQQGDVLSVKYDINRRPIFRNADWYYYAVWCTSNDLSTLEFPLGERMIDTTFPALLSNSSDGQNVGLNMDTKGVFKIFNKAQGGIFVSCVLYKKFGL